MGRTLRLGGAVAKSNDIADPPKLKEPHSILASRCAGFPLLLLGTGKWLEESLPPHRPTTDGICAK